MSITLWPNGVGGSLGDGFVIEKPLQVSGTIYYVDSVTGNNSFSGKERERPFATLAAAIAVVAHEDIVVLLGTHNETVTGVITISFRIMIVGEGSSGGLPTAKLTMNAAAATLLALNTSNIELRNIYFPENAQTNSGVKINMTGAAMCRIVGCYFPANAKDTAACISLGAGGDKAIIKNCTFVSTATSTSAVPGGAIQSVSAITDLELQNCIFDDGACGYGNSGAVSFSGGAITRLKAEGVSLLNGADAALNAASTGWFNVGTTTGGGRVSW